MNLTRRQAGITLAGAAITLGVARCSSGSTTLTPAEAVADLRSFATGLLNAVKQVAPNAIPAGTVTTVPSRSCESAREVWVTKTWAPPAGAGPLRVTVPVAGLRPVTLVGLTVTEASTRVGGGGVTLNRV